MKKHELEKERDNTARQQSTVGKSVKRFDEMIDRKVGSISPPTVLSFRNFLENHARVPGGRRGEYCQYSFEGREALIEVVKVIDDVLGSHGRPALTDATISICGGAQFGKSATELNLGAYCTGVAWLNWGFY